MCRQVLVAPAGGCACLLLCIGAQLAGQCARAKSSRASRVVRILEGCCMQRGCLWFDVEGERGNARFFITDFFVLVGLLFGGFEHPLARAQGNDFNHALQIGCA